MFNSDVQINCLSVLKVYDVKSLLKREKKGVGAEDVAVRRLLTRVLCLQMVWENGCVVIVMLTPLVESGVKQCYHYWPDEGSNLYHIYEVRTICGEISMLKEQQEPLMCSLDVLQVNLVSEHIWCDDFLVRSFYLKNMQTNETRTVTQFHFLTWLNQNVPETSRTLLDFRR